MIGLNKMVERLARVNEKLLNACKTAGREGEKVTLVAVSKTFPAEFLDAAISEGVTDLGESRVQEFEAKKPLVKGSARWHLIGHLQKNKVKKALQLFDLIQSVDSFALAEEISRRAEKEIEILVQVNSSGEDSKFGYEPSQLTDEVVKIAELNNIKVSGLMTIGPYTNDESKIRKSYKLVKELFDKLKRFETDKLRMKHLSMGMSGDFELAILEGANMVRVGSLIFGSRG